MKIQSRILQPAACGLALAAVLTAATTVNAQDLYPADVLNLIQPFDGTIEDHVAIEDVSVIRSRPVIINPGHLRHVRPDPNAQFEIELFDDVRVWATFRSFEQLGPNEFTCTGDLSDHAFSSFVISVVDDYMVAEFRALTAGSFQVRYLADGVHVLREVNTRGRCGLASVQPPEADAEAPRPRAAAGSRGDGPGGLVAGDDGSRIHVLVVYTEDLRRGEGGYDPTHALINAAIADTNDRFDRSEISKRVRLVGRKEVGYAETGNGHTDLSRLRDPDDGHMDAVHGWREYDGADLVALLVKHMGNDVLGVGNRPANQDQLKPSFGFSVTKGSAATEGTFAHELGHNFGCHHHPNDEGAGNDPVIYDYAFGHRFHTFKYRTTMAYSPDGLWTRIPHFSNPNVNYQSGPTGTSGRNNTRVIRNTAEKVAKYGQSVMWVDFDSGELFPDGTRYNPYRFLWEGVFNVPDGHRLRFKGGSTPETALLDKPMTLETDGSPATIGL